MKPGFPPPQKIPVFPVKYPPRRYDFQHSLNPQVAPI